MNMYVKKKRRKRRVKRKNWVAEITNGNISGFYNSTDWDVVREAAMIRDKFICQFYNGEYTENGHKPFNLKLKTATHVHHIKPIKERPDLALDINNLVSLSHEAHEIIEGRRMNGDFKNGKILTTERW